MLPNMYLKMIGFKELLQKWSVMGVTATGLLLLRVVDPNCKLKPLALLPQSNYCMNHLWEEDFGQVWQFQC